MNDERRRPREAELRRQAACCCVARPFEWLRMTPKSARLHRWRRPELVEAGAGQECRRGRRRSKKNLRLGAVERGLQEWRERGEERAGD